ncbi:MAG: hypothetical protein A2Y16_06950 [Tenericutes bacterium GWF2_57_13]|nr:MAG: hypothetical protein A2Y16_06950 [Tenericutes bacterium GWF2_57_13]
MSRNRRGVTLPELLGAIVILALVTSLLSAVAFAMVRAIDRIAVNESAETTGLSLISQLENAMEDARPNTYSQTCEGTGGCVVLIQEYIYEYDPVDGMIDPVIHASPIEKTLSIHDNAIWIDAAMVGTGVFTIGPASTLAVVDDAGTVTVTISFELLAADGRTFPFTAIYEFNESAIPA